MAPSREPSPPDAAAPIDPAAPPEYQPEERLWPYADLSEHHSEEELAALVPDLRAALFGRRFTPFSVTLVFPPFEGPDYERALAMARASAEYLVFGEGRTLKHRARFFPGDVHELRDLFEIVGRSDRCEVLIDDHPMPYARELWLPLLWFLIPRLDPAAKSVSGTDPENG